jgi:serine/threonine protein kinase
MGEVYLAADIKLKRCVALKLLPKNVVSDEERVRRFRQGARAAARVLHPNVAQVYEVGKADEIHYIAIEHVEGETLREKLKRHPLAPDEILKIAEQIVRALQAAHAAGVVHRDLKPENVVCKADGQVKVIDFSLAKLTSRAFSADQSSPSFLSLTGIFITEPGVVMGTAAYMSPEQARGQAVDVRTDIWSFGVMLYGRTGGNVR